MSVVSSSSCCRVPRLRGEGSAHICLLSFFFPDKTRGRAPCRTTHTVTGTGGGGPSLTFHTTPSSLASPVLGGLRGERGPRPSPRAVPPGAAWGRTALQFQGIQPELLPGTPTQVPGQLGSGPPKAPTCPHCAPTPGPAGRGWSTSVQKKAGDRRGRWRGNQPTSERVESEKCETSRHWTWAAMATWHQVRSGDAQPFPVAAGAGRVREVFLGSAPQGRSGR